MDKQSMLYEVINPMHLSWALLKNLETVTQILECIYTSTEKVSQKCNANHPEGTHSSNPSFAIQDFRKPAKQWND